MAHAWRFQRIGGFDQVLFDTAEDLRHLGQLDQKLWVALACPVQGNQLDARTLELIDRDGDGRVRAPDVIAAIEWCDATFVHLECLLKSQDGVELANLADEQVLASAKRVLKGLGRPDDVSISVQDSTNAKQVLDAMPFNGDGVLPRASVEDEELGRVLEEVLAVTGGVLDRSGAMGIDRSQLETVWAQLEAYEAWWKEAEESEDEVVPLGERTAAAVKAFVAVKEKVEDYFTRCELAAFDPRAQAHLVGAEKRWEDLGGHLLSRADDEVASFPLSAIAPGRPLALAEGINPAWAERMVTFKSQAVTPLLGEIDALDRGHWADLRMRFTAYESWLHGKQGQAVEALGIARVRALLEGDSRRRLEALIDRDASRKPEADSLEAVDRATRYQRDLYTLLRNFVTFKDFYKPGRKAMFQAGVLYLDGRSCELVMRVEDIAKHSAMAAQSYAYVAYCDCQRRATGQKMSIAAAFTDGDSDFLAVGRNGLLYDRNGDDWDATIVKISEQPISIRQAFWAPYKRLIRFIGEQAQKWAADQDKASQKGLEAKALSGAEAAPAGAATAFDIGKFAGIFAALGLGIGFMISGVTIVVGGFLSLRLWQMPLALLGVIMLISGPSMLIAAFKLRLRNLAPLLDANGWAVNARARLNISFGSSLTQVAALPPGSSRDLKDPLPRSPLAPALAGPRRGCGLRPRLGVGSGAQDAAHGERPVGPVGALEHPRPTPRGDPPRRAVAAVHPVAVAEDQYPSPASARCGASPSSSRTRRSTPPSMSLDASPALGASGWAATWCWRRASPIRASCSTSRRPRRPASSHTWGWRSRAGRGQGKLALDAWGGRIGRLERVLSTMGAVVAWAQLRSSGRQGSASADALLAFGARSDWRAPLVAWSEAYAETVRSDWEVFSSWLGAQPG